MNTLANILLANKLSIVIVLLFAILTTVGIIAHNSAHQTALIEQAVQPLPQPAPLTEKQIDETAQKPLRPTLLP